MEDQSAKDYGPMTTDYRPVPGRGQHRKYRPYAFTEQGVAMLSSVLRFRHLNRAQK